MTNANCHKRVFRLIDKYQAELEAIEDNFNENPNSASVAISVRSEFMASLRNMWNGMEAVRNGIEEWQEEEINRLATRKLIFRIWAKIKPWLPISKEGLWNSQKQ